MTPIDFPQRNLMLAEDQPEYQTLPTFVDKRAVETEKGPKEIPWSMTCVYEFTEEEIAEIVAKKKLFCRQMLFGHSFQPIFMSTKDPFLPENKQHWPAE
jgi:hypothetical protein